MFRSSFRIGALSRQLFSTNRIIEINGKKQFQTAVAANKKCLIDLYADWCGPCRLMLPKLKTAIENKTEWTLLKVNVDENSDIANEYGVKSIPTFVIYKNGKFVETKVGSLSEEALDKLLD